MALNRREKIAVIKQSIAEAKDPDLKLLEIQICSRWGCSLRTAQELIKVAKEDVEKQDNKKIEDYF